MKQSTQLRVLGTLFISLSSLSAFAQAQVETLQLDTLTKVIAIGATIGGFFLGYMQMKMANKIAELEARVNQSMHALQEKLEDKIKLSTAAIEMKLSSVATHHDINNMKQINLSYHELTQEKLKGFERQMQISTEAIKSSDISKAADLLKAAELLKRDKNG